MTDFRTFGDRLTAIRVALGSQRKPMSYRELSRLIKEKTGHDVSHETLRVYDMGERRILWDDAIAIAAIDPEGRGLEWLAGEEIRTDAQDISVASTPQDSHAVPAYPPATPPLQERPGMLRTRKRRGA
jgi:hypothetical protein